jgi:phospholipase C
MSLRRPRLGAAVIATLAAACGGSTHEGPDASSSADAAASAGDAGPTDAPGASCPSAVAADPHSADRLACTFKAGAKAADTVGLDEAARAAIPIKHIVVMMKENRSFDHIFGGLGALQPDAEVFPATFTNPDAGGAAVAPYHLANTCVGFDPDHQWNAMHAQIDGGKMDGYVKSAASTTGSDGHFALGYYEQADLPFDYWLATTFAIADHDFASVRSGTFPNRDYMLLGTSDKVTATQFSVWPDPSLPSIFDELDHAGVTWGVYGDDHALEETLNNPAKNFEAAHPPKSVQALIDGFAAGDLPQVVFVDGRENIEDEHATADLQVGEQWTKRLYDAAAASTLWNQTVIFYTYDEAGGFFDHVPPPDDACLARPADSMFHELGTRVPLIAISPWARRHYVSHTRKEHVSITRFIEAVFGLPALTARDANADALLDMFDFTCAPGVVPAAPAAGTGGCGGNANLTVSQTSYVKGDPIVFTFSGGLGNPKDWIGVYPRNVAPHSGSTIWGYVGGGGHTATTGVTAGTITLAAGSQNNAGDWPLPVGQWTAYFLVNDGYTSIASVPFDVK